jgi:hypothetical protein
MIYNEADSDDEYKVVYLDNINSNVIRANNQDSITDDIPSSKFSRAIKRRYSTTSSAAHQREEKKVTYNNYHKYFFS